MKLLDFQMRCGVEPEAPKEHSRWWSPAEPPDCGKAIVARRRCARNLPKVAVIEFDQSTSQHAQILIFEGGFLMVFFLVENVGTHLFQVWRTNCETSIALLPCKLRQPKGLFDPSGRIAFHLPHHVTQPVGRLKARQDVDVIANSSNGKSDTSLAFNNSSQICVDSWSNFSVEPVFPVLGAEDQVVIKRSMGRGHISTLAPPSGRNQFPMKTGGSTALHHRLGSYRASGSFRRLKDASENPGVVKPRRRLPTHHPEFQMNPTFPTKPNGLFHRSPGHRPGGSGLSINCRLKACLTFILF